MLHSKRLVGVLLVSLHTYLATVYDSDMLAEISVT
jgi:hypothetical protein